MGSRTESGESRSAEGEGAVERALAAALSAASPLLVVGDEDRAARLRAAQPDRFPQAAGHSAGVLALGADEKTLRDAVEAARETDAVFVHVLLDREREQGLRAGSEEARRRLRDAGLLLARVERILWAAPPNGIGGATRAERLEEETAAALLTCIPARRPQAAVELEEELARLRAELELHAGLELEHARTREAERLRADRLRELEDAFERLGGLALAPEVERLRAEIEWMRGTRVWRTGARWWAFRSRLRRDGGRGAPGG